jgi:predicted metalloprotease
MKWEDREESENVEDRRGLGKKAGLAIGGGGGLVILILALVFGVDPQQLANMVGGQAVQQGNGDQPAAPHSVDPEQDKLASFSKVVLHDTEQVWVELFSRMGKTYEKPMLVLFSDQTDSACGHAESAVGPFYCGADKKVYIDLSFFKDMQKRLGAPGEFARAYVIAHEVGHHVQHLLGYSKRAEEGRRAASKAEAHKFSVRLELQADYLAGVWAFHAQKKYHFLEPGDVELALNAAFQIGDDRLQKKARGVVVPDSFTHGTSKQRQRWFSEGFKTGDVGKARLLFDLDYNEL